MQKKISLGIDIFDNFVGNKTYYYVDKTELIYELVEETPNAVTLFTRPRRFGKSLVMSMLASFFDIQNAGSKVFDDLNIMKNHPEFCKEWMHQYPALLISFKDVEGLSFDEAYKMLGSIISKLCINISDTVDKEGVKPVDRETFNRLLNNKKASANDIKNSMETLMRMLHAVYGKPVILLIDEYDVPLAKAHENGYYKEMLDVMRGIMSISLKSNEYLKFAVVTGCLRISKESIFTGVNNFTSYSVLDEDFSNYFGFTEDEVKEILKYYNLENKLGIIKKWYDGYIFGNTEIYCPWDVMSYMAALIKRPYAKPKNYWQNTSGNEAIKEFFKLGNGAIIEELEILLNRGSIIKNVSDTLTYEEAYTSADNLWSFLLMTGYITTVKQEEPDTDEDLEDYDGFESIELRIPNREVEGIFKEAVVDNFKKTVDQGKILELMEALWSGDEDTASKILSGLLLRTISYMDYHENYYHAFISGIFAGGGYMPQSNKERGLGRPDVCIKDISNSRMLIIECKKADSEEKLDYFCDQAIEQIINKKYAWNANGYRTVLCYGIAFFEKSAKIKLMK